MRLARWHYAAGRDCSFPYFFVGTFIEAEKEIEEKDPTHKISLLFRRDFH